MLCCVYTTEAQPERSGQFGFSAAGMGFIKAFGRMRRMLVLRPSIARGQRTIMSSKHSKTWSQSVNFVSGLPSLKPCSGKWYRPWVPDSSWLIQIVPIHTTNMDPGWFLKALLHGKESPQKTTPLPICRANTPSSCSHRWCQPARIGQLCGAHVDSWLCSPDPTRYLIKTVPSFMASWFSLSTPSKGFLKLSGSFCCIAPDSMTFFRNNP